MSSVFDFPLVCEYCEGEYQNDDEYNQVSDDGLDFCCEECMNSYAEREEAREYDEDEDED
jgi:hypothetical protein